MEDAVYECNYWIYQMQGAGEIASNGKSKPNEVMFLQSRMSFVYFNFQKTQCCFNLGY